MSLDKLLQDGAAAAEKAVADNKALDAAYNTSPAAFRLQLERYHKEALINAGFDTPEEPGGHTSG